MTGDFDAEARARELAAQQNKGGGDSSEDGSEIEKPEEQPDSSGAFYHKL